MEAGRDHLFGFIAKIGESEGRLNLMRVSRKGVKQFRERFLTNRLLGLGALLIFAAVVLYWSIFPSPPPGVGIAISAIATAVIGFRTKIRTVEKVFWLAIVIGFVFVEMRAIDADRKEHADEQAKALHEERASFAKLLKQEQAHFEQVLNESSALRKQSEERFAKILAGAETILLEQRRTLNASNKTVALAKESMERATGGSSYPIVRVSLEEVSPDDPRRFPIWIETIGRHALRDVHIQLRQNPSGVTRVIPIEGGVLVPGLTVTGSALERGSYNLTIITSNGGYEEILNIYDCLAQPIQTVQLFRGSQLIYKEVYDQANCGLGPEWP